MWIEIWLNLYGAHANGYRLHPEESRNPLLAYARQHLQSPKQNHMHSQNMRRPYHMRESETLAELKKQLPGIKAKGLTDSVFFCYQMFCNRSLSDNRIAVKENDRKNFQAPFLPDATRIIFQDYDGEIIPCIQLWEIENFHPVSAKKLQKIRRWVFWHFDNDQFPDFEVWICNRFGVGHHRLFSFFGEEYGWVGKPTNRKPYSEKERCPLP